MVRNKIGKVHLMPNNPQKAQEIRDKVKQRSKCCNMKGDVK